MKRTSSNTGATKPPTTGFGYNKKIRANEEDEPSFEDELGMMDDSYEYEKIEEDNSGGNNIGVSESQEGRWKRPPPSDATGST